MFIRRRRKKSDIPDGTTAKKYNSNILYESNQNKGPQKPFTVTEKPENFENRRISETKDQHIYHEIESKEDKIVMSGPADRIPPGVESKEVDGLTEKEAHTRPAVNEKTETASQKSQGGTESPKSTVLSSDDDNKQPTVEAKVTTPERGDEPEVKQNADSPTVVSGDDKQKTDDNLKREPYTKTIEDTLNSTENTGINIYDNKTESKPTPSTVARPPAEKPINKKNVSVIQVCKF